MNPEYAKLVMCFSLENFDIINSMFVKTGDGNIRSMLTANRQYETIKKVELETGPLQTIYSQKPFFTIRRLPQEASAI